MYKWSNLPSTFDGAFGWPEYFSVYCDINTQIQYGWRYYFCIEYTQVCSTLQEYDFCITWLVTSIVDLKFYLDCCLKCSFWRSIIFLIFNRIDFCSSLHVPAGGFVQAEFPHSQTILNKSWNEFAGIPIDDWIW